MKNLEDFFSKQDKDVYVATQDLQDFLLGEKEKRGITWKILSKRIGGISPEFLGSIARGTSSNRFSAETKGHIENYIISTLTNTQEFIDLSTVSTSALLSEIEKRLVSRNNVKIPHSCPVCETKAVNFEELDEKFGLRKTGESITQNSWCRSCRRSTHHSI